MEMSRQASHLASRSYRGGIPDLVGGDDGGGGGAGVGAGAGAGAAAGGGVLGRLRHGGRGGGFRETEVGEEGEETRTAEEERKVGEEAEKGWSPPLASPQRFGWNEMGRPRE
ncbi:hypothetical protein OsJ_13310 [Oryza sativa Japonica Group]|uniref:Uncharacterized protein n=1 Tax=Oryza sativa subsp. japonica TaxID=39947 RepID=A3APK8_ORYSJ|nr:hypothetical protein OsJ_13310 [Oryza sativa Japonica Group]